MNSRRRRKIFICPSPCEARAREPRSRENSTPEACGPYPWRGCQIGYCTAESRPPPPTGLWQRWVINRKAHSVQFWSAFSGESRHAGDEPLSARRIVEGAAHRRPERRLGLGAERQRDYRARRRWGRASAPIRSTLRSTVTAHPATRRSDPEAPPVP